MIVDGFREHIENLGYVPGSGPLLQSVAASARTAVGQEAHGSLHDSGETPWHPSRRRRAPPKRLVRQFADHSVARPAFAATPPTPPIRPHNPTGQHSAVGLDPLPSDFEAKLVETAERGQVRASEGSVRHVEVFQMGGVGTSILDRP
jgi:hypothetical protein